jgi:hypothetical protein
MSALGLLRGVLLCAHLIDIANAHASARAEALAHEVPSDRLAPILDLAKLPEETEDGRPISRDPAHHLENVLRKRIARGEIPPPDTVGVSIAMLMRVVRACSKLNENDLGCYASLTYLSERCDASPSQIRAAHNYLVTYGHSLRLSRLSADDRKVGGAKRPLKTARSTIRPVYALTCDMAESLTEEQVFDLIALGEKEPKAELRSEGRDEHESQGQTEARPTAGGGQEPATAQPLVRDLAPEHRCLVEPLAALALFAGVKLPPGSIEWVADEADRAGLVDYDNVDFTHAADALNELHGKFMEERRGAEAMGERPPKFRGGRAALRSLIIDYLKGRALWLKKHGDVFKARDAARAREQAHEASLSPEQRERRGIAPLQGVGRETASAGNEPAAPALQKPRPVATPAATPTPHELEVNRLNGRIAVLGARIFAAASAATRAELEAERTAVEAELAVLLKRGPPE